MFEILNSLEASISARKKQVYTLPFPLKLLNEYLHSIPNTERDSLINYRLKFDCHSLWKKKKIESFEEENPIFSALGTSVIDIYKNLKSRSHVHAQLMSLAHEMSD